MCHGTRAGASRRPGVSYIGPRGRAFNARIGATLRRYLFQDTPGDVAALFMTSIDASMADNTDARDDAKLELGAQPPEPAVQLAPPVATTPATQAPAKDPVQPPPPPSNPVIASMLK